VYFGKFKSKQGIKACTVEKGELSISPINCSICQRKIGLSWSIREASRIWVVVLKEEGRKRTVVTALFIYFVIFVVVKNFF
jgi:hypothetical protein